MLARVTIVLVFLALQAPLAQADVYVWVDAEGVSHFTNTPTDRRYRLFIRERDKVRLSGGLAGRPDLENYIDSAARRYNIDCALIKAIIKAESDFDPEAVSRDGARGLMQLMPATALEVECLDAFDPQDNIRGGVRYLRKLLDLFGDVGLALAAYNAGPEAVMKHKGLPPFSETRAYVDRVLRYYSHYKREAL